MSIKLSLISIVGSIILVATPVLAQDQGTASANQQTRMQNAISKADSEIARRISSLNTLISRIQGMNKISDTDKANYISQAQTQISNLTSFKTKIDADTDLPTLRADIKAIFNQYRIYMLFIPKTHILAAADRMNDTADTANTLATTKLLPRIVAAGNPAVATAAYSDLLAKLADAKTQYLNAQNSVSGLTPDAGDTGKMATNKASLQSAWGMIKAGAADLKAARADLQTIVQTLKGLKSASSTPVPTSKWEAN